MDENADYRELNVASRLVHCNTTKTQGVIYTQVWCFE
jgi:hypothetical protein